MTGYKMVFVTGAYATSQSSPLGDRLVTCNRIMAFLNDEDAAWLPAHYITVYPYALITKIRNNRIDEMRFRHRREDLLGRCDEMWIIETPDFRKCETLQQEIAFADQHKIRRYKLDPKTFLVKTMAFASKARSS